MENESQDSKDNDKIEANNEIINEPQPQEDNNEENNQENNEENNQENRLNEDSDYNILPDANFSSDMVNLTAYLQQVNDSIYENPSIKSKIDLIKNDDKVVELSWKKPFMNGYIKKLQSEIVSNSPRLTEEQENNNTKISYYIEALNNHREYYLINKDDEFVTDLTTIIMPIIQDVFKVYIEQNKVIIQVDEPVEHFKFKNKHPDILFYNHVSHNIVIKWNNGDASNDAFLNHIETKGKTILFTFVRCKVDEELYDEYIKPNFITESYIKSNEMDIDGSKPERQSKYYFFNRNFLVTFLPLLKFLPRDILPFAIARANALKYTFENQPDLNSILSNDDPTKQDKTLQYGIMKLFILIKDNIYPFYLTYTVHSDEIKSRIFQIIEWAATVSNAKVTVISKNMEKQSKKPIYNYTGTGENNEIIEEPVKKSTGSMDDECPVERKEILENTQQFEEETYENLKDFYSNFDTELLDYYPDLYVLDNIDDQYKPDPSRKLPSLRQLSRFISTIFCLYLLLNDKGYASVSGGDLFRYLLYDEIKTSADLDYVFWLNDENDKEEIIYKLISSLVLLIAFLQSALYFRDLKHFIEFDMFGPENKSYKFIIEINGKGDHNKFTMRTMNNPDKFPVTLLSVDCNLKKRMYFITDEDEYIKFKTNIVDEKENTKVITNLHKSTYLSSENYYVLAAIDMVIKDVTKIDEELRVNINTEMETGNSKEIIRFSSDLMGIRYLTDEQGEMIKTDDTDNYFTLIGRIQTDTGSKKIDDIISGVRTNYSNEAKKLEYYNKKLEYYNDIIEQKLQIPSIFTNSNDEIMEEDKESEQLTKKQRDKIGNKTGYPVLLTPSVTPEAMLTLVNEVLKHGFKLARIIGDKDKKDKKRKDNIEERIHCLIAQMYKDIEVIELDAVNNVKTGPIIRILRELIEMIVYKQPMTSLEATIPEKYNIFIPDNKIVVTKLNELLQNINSQLIIDTDSDSSSDKTYYPEDVENNESQGETVSSVYNSQNSQSSLGELSQHSIDIGMYPGFSLSAEPVISKKVTDALSRQTNVPFKKAPKSISSFGDLIREITERLYNLTTTNTRSGKIPPKKILPNKSKILTVIPEDNRKEDIIINDEKYIWVEEVNGEHHYRKEGDLELFPTLYLRNGNEIDYGPVPELVEIVQEEKEEDKTDYGGKRSPGGKRGPGGKRSPGGKRTLKRRRDKKKTRKTGNKKNKNKKRVSRVNKKRIGKKTRKNM
uniref:Uncharacterized protein n=1 Tax=viral metagenome TaxID=1070528 RepID=A0A6C0HA23_9ZZZZ